MATSKIAITEFPDVKSKQGEVKQTTFEQLAFECSTPNKGGKHGLFWIRGELDPVQRKKSNLAESKLLVIDGDCSLSDSHSAPPSDALHDILKSWGVKHFIYSTHSKTEANNKFRCVIECNLEDEQHLKHASKAVCDKLNDFDYPIAWVKEMGSWIQPWFYPRRDDPNDGLFEFFEYLDGTPLEITVEEIVQEVKSTTKYDEKESWKNRIKQIAESERFHENLRDLTWAGVKDNADPSIIRALAEASMELVQTSERDERWQDRYDSIPRIISEGITKHKRETEDDENNLVVPSVPSPVLEGQLPLPEGNLGLLIKSVYDNQRYQYEEIALVTALGLIAGIAGRRYNVSRTGLNLYLTLIMGTGMGKDSINEYMEKIMVSLNINSIQAQPMSFLGAGRFTGPKALYGGLKNALSQVCVFTEAGLLLSGRTGDPTGLTRALLSLYTLSGSGRFSKPELFSSDDNSIGILYSPALTILNEATPETLLQAFKDSNAIETGDLPRQSIYRINRTKPYANKSAKFHIPDTVSAKLVALVEECSVVQTEAQFDPIEITYHPDIVQDIEKHDSMWVDRYNESFEINTLAANMSTRMHLKALKFAAIATIMNRADNVLTNSEWSWAKKLVQYEYDGLDSFFLGSGNAEIDGTMFLVAKAIVNILDNKLKSNKASLDVRYRKRKIISMTSIKQVLKNNRKVRMLDTNSYGKIRLGIEIILDKFIEDGLLKPIDDPFGNKKGCLQITKEFKHVFGEYYDIN